MDDANINREIIFTIWDNLYKRLKTVDESSQKLDFDRNIPNLKEAMLGYIASFGLSMIKDLYLQNTDSVGFLLSIRCIIEGVAVYTYACKKEINDARDDVFRIQAYLIEKEIYENYPSLDGVLFNLQNIRDNYEKSKQFIINKFNYSSKKFKELLQSKVPSLGSVKSFETLIRDNLSEELLIMYKSISLYVHPYDYRLNNKELFNQYSIATFMMLKEIFDDVTPSKYGLEFEYNRVIGENEFGQITRIITNYQREKLSKLCQMIDDIGFNFLVHTIDTCGVILYDFFLDIAMGYTEQSTTKWKSSLENLWMLNLCIEDDYFGKLNQILHHHSHLKSILNLGKEPDEIEYRGSYDVYKSKYPSGCDYGSFKKIFISTTGYTIDEKGEVKSLRKSVFELIDELSVSINGGILDSIVKDKPFEIPTKADLDNIKKIDISSYLKMKYDESQAMSHASGYLYYSLSGAWYDGNFLAILYDELLHILLKKLLNKFVDMYKNEKISKTIVNFLRNFIKDNSDYIEKKKMIYLMPKVPKNY